MLGANDLECVPADQVLFLASRRRRRRPSRFELPEPRMLRIERLQDHRLERDRCLGTTAASTCYVADTVACLLIRTKEEYLSGTREEDLFVLFLEANICSLL